MLGYLQPSCICTSAALYFLLSHGYYYKLCPTVRGRKLPENGEGRDIPACICYTQRSATTLQQQHIHVHLRTPQISHPDHCTPAELHILAVIVPTSTTKSSKPHASAMAAPMKWLRWFKALEYCTAQGSAQRCPIAYLS